MIVADNEIIVDNGITFLYDGANRDEDISIVIEAHTPPVTLTEEEIIKKLAKEALAGRDPTQLGVVVFAKMIESIMVQTRTEIELVKEDNRRLRQNLRDLDIEIEEPEARPALTNFENFSQAASYWSALIDNASI